MLMGIDYYVLYGNGVKDLEQDRVLSRIWEFAIFSAFPVTFRYYRHFTEIVKFGYHRHV